MIAKSDHTPLVTSVDGKTHYEYYTDEEFQVYISCKTAAAKSAKIVRNVAETLSDLERENSELKGDIVNVKDDIYSILTKDNIEFEIGGLKCLGSLNIGEYEDATNRIRTKIIQKALKGSKIVAESGYSFSIVEYKYALNPDYIEYTSALRTTGWIKEWIAIEDCYVALKFRKDDDSVIPTTDKSHISIGLIQYDKRELDMYSDVTGTLIDGKTLICGSGEIKESSSYELSNFIDVNEGDELLITACMGGTYVSNNQTGIVGFDSKGNFVTDLLNYRIVSGYDTGNNRTGVSYYKVVVPSGVSKIRGSSAYVDNGSKSARNLKIYIRRNSEKERKRFISDVEEIKINIDKYNDKLFALSRYNSLSSSGSYYNPIGEKKDFTFSVLTDVHGDSTATEKWIDFSNKYKEFIDYAICLGDSVAKKIDDDFAFFINAIDKSEIPVLNCIGNHDIGDPWNGLSGGSMNLSTAFNRYIKPIKDKGWVDTDKCYWFKDLSKYKIRLIGLNPYEANVEATNNVEEYMYSCYFSSEQLQWFADTLYSTPTGYTVLIVTHQIPSAEEEIERVNCDFSISERFGREFYVQRTMLNGTPIEDIINAYRTRGVISEAYTSKTSKLSNSSVSKDFSDSNSNLYACMITGHTHFSAITKSKKYNDQIIVVCPSSSNNLYQRSFDDIRPNGDNNIYTISVDTEYKLIKILKIGNTLTDDMIAREQIAIPY